MWAGFAEAVAKIIAAVFGGFMTWKAGRDDLLKDQAEKSIKVKEKQLKAVVDKPSARKRLRDKSI